VPIVPHRSMREKACRRDSRQGWLKLGHGCLAWAGEADYRRWTVGMISQPSAARIRCRTSW
jgi:hypothetical protein